MSADTTEIVYVCSPDRERQLFTSLETLARSKSQVDRIVIYCVGEPPPHWSDRGTQIVVHPVNPLFGDYFYGNKLYICQSAASRLVFLDADTFVLRPLEELWLNRTEEFLARPGSVYGNPRWRPEVWRDTLTSVGSKEIPMFNAGVLIFQNQSHRTISNLWATYIRKYLSRDFLRPYPSKRMPEQWALSLAVGALNLKYGLLDCSHHAYAWMDEEYSSTIVYHSGNGRHEKYANLFGFGAR